MSEKESPKGETGAEEAALLAAKQKAADEEAVQERADMEAIGRSFMNTLTIVTSEPGWKDWTPAEDPVELVIDMLAMIDELKEKVPAEPEPLPEGTRTTPLNWDELAPYSVPGTCGIAAWVLEGAMMSVIMKTEPHSVNSTENWGPFHGASDGGMDALLAYAIERRPSPEVLFNKARELGICTGAFEDLLPVDRVSFELAARLLPATADTIEALNAAIVVRNPAPAMTDTGVAVDIEDTIFEPIDGLVDIDQDRALAQAKADKAMAERAAAKPRQGRKARSITEGAE